VPSGVFNSVCYSYWPIAYHVKFSSGSFCGDYFVDLRNVYYGWDGRKSVNNIITKLSPLNTLVDDVSD